MGLRTEIDMAGVRTADHVRRSPVITGDLPGLADPVGLIREMAACLPAPGKRVGVLVCGANPAPAPFSVPT